MFQMEFQPNDEYMPDLVNFSNTKNVMLFFKSKSFYYKKAFGSGEAQVKLNRFVFTNYSIIKKSIS